MTPPAGGFFRSGPTPMLTQRERVADFARVQVRAGLLDPQAMLAEVEQVVAGDLPGHDPAATARQLLAEAAAELESEQLGWARPTDYERLQDAFTALAQHRVIVLQAVEDHWVADTELRHLARVGAPAAGVVWFTQPDVWHAVDHGMLELNVWHADAANVTPGDRLLDLVMEALAQHGLTGHFDEGRVEVAAHWRRPPGAA